MEIIPKRPTLKQRWEDFKWEVKWRFNSTVLWFEEHKELVILAVPVVVTVIGEGGKLIRRASSHSDLKRQEELKDLYIYDRSAGHYWKLSRKLTQSEWIEVETRHKNGEPYSQILSDMRVLA